MKRAIDMSSQAVRNQIAEAQKIASGGGSEVDVAEAKIELEVSSITLDSIAYRRMVSLIV